jgi:CDP-diacylglycerol pyrophosphatase
MSEPKKLDEQEVQELKEFSARWDLLTKRLGELHYQKKAVDAELMVTEEALDKLDQERYDALNKLQTKYGTGQLNLTAGTFTPDA